MKCKFYEVPPALVIDEEGDSRDFTQEIAFISNLLHIKSGRIRISADHPCGEDVIFIDGVYNGYLDSDFYSFMDNWYDPYGDYEQWIAEYRRKK